MNTIKNVSLYYKGGSSDKEYHLQIVPSGTGYVVNFQYGKRGSALTPGSKTNEPVSLEKATKIYEAKLKEQLGKGYQEGEVKEGFTSSNEKTKEVIMVPQLLNEIQEEEIDRYINDASYLAQEKKDGQRRMVIADGERAIGLNKKGQKVDLPNSIEYAVVGTRCILDGEIVGDQLFVFDLLEKDLKDLKHLGCRERIAILKAIKFGKSITVVETCYTARDKRTLYEELKAKNAEGIVFKNKNAEYRSGRPASGGDQLKFKFTKTATCMVEGTTPGKRSVGLLMMDGKKQVNVGKVTIPPNQSIPKAGDLIEVRYLYAYQGGCLFQPVYLGLRTDSDITDAGIGQLIYKSEEVESE